jgi:3-oxoacyl-[acyl-carrier-protein] synthase II
MNDMRYHLGYKEPNDLDRERYLNNSTYEELCREAGIEGPVMAIDSACATGLDAVIMAFKAVKHNFDINTAIVISNESSIDPLLVSLFHKISALNCEYNENPEDAPAPFSHNRCGFIMGESSAAVVIEDLEQALARNAPIFCEIIGSGTNSDAFHLTRPQEDGLGL